MSLKKAAKNFFQCNPTVNFIVTRNNDIIGNIVGLNVSDLHCIRVISTNTEILKNDVLTNKAGEAFFVEAVKIVHREIEELIEIYYL